MLRGLSGWRRHFLGVLLATFVSAGLVTVGGVSASADDAPPPLVTVPPVVSGFFTKYATLTAYVSPFEWTPQPTSMTYQWNRDGVAIPNATDLTYTLGSADVGHRLSFTATGSLSGYATTPATSVATPKIALGHLKLPRPTITGTAGIGHALTAHEPGFQPSYFYDAVWVWTIGGVLDPFVQGRTYYPASAADVGKRVTVAMLIEPEGHPDQSSEPSKATAPIADGAVLHATVSAYGRVNLPLDFDYSGPQWQYAGTQSVRWLLDGQPYTPAADDLATASDWHHRLQAVVTTTIPGFPPFTVTSKSTLVTTGYFTGGPTITGTDRVGSRLTISDPGIRPTPTKLSYKWYLGIGPDEQGAYLGSGSSLMLTTRELGKHVFGYAIVSGAHVESDGLNANPVLIGKGIPVSDSPPAVTGNAVVGGTLQATSGSWTPQSGLTFTYQWWSETGGASAVAVKGATSPRLKLGAALLGKTLYVAVSTHRSGYSSATADSTPTSAVTVN